MSRNARALLLALALVAPFLLHPHANAEPRDYVREVVCAPSLRWDCGSMLDIAWRESGFDNTAINPQTGCACWFQIHPIHGYDPAVLTSDPLACTFAAYGLWLADGYRPWR